MRKTTLALLVLASIASVATGCSAATQKSSPDPKESNIVNGRNTQTIQMPEGYRNITFTCYGPNGIYVTSRGSWKNSTTNIAALPSDIAVVPNDPQCAK